MIIVPSLEDESILIILIIYCIAFAEISISASTIFILLQQIYESHAES